MLKTAASVSYCPKMKRTKLFIKWHNEKVIKVIKKCQSMIITLSSILQI